ncbi:MAG: DUF1461 domain-containing protein [Clostridia bacterium]|nr:DUF1461 domain-containing protein [Clostridia bacterium]
MNNKGTPRVLFKENMKKFLSCALTALFTISLFLTFGLIAIVVPATSPSFYKWQFEKYGVLTKVQNQSYRLSGSAKEYIENISSDELISLMSHVMRYCLFLESDLNPTVNGETLEVFREDEVSHMQDVKNVFGGGLTIIAVCLVIIAVSLVLYIIYRKGYYLNCRKVPLITLAVLLGLLLLIALFAVIDFDLAFTIFHRLLFEGNWQFSSGVMVNLISYIFNDLVFIIAGIWGLLTALFITLVILLNKKYKKSAL